MLTQLVEGVRVPHERRKWVDHSNWDVGFFHGLNAQLRTALCELVRMRHLQRQTVHVCPTGQSLRCVQALRVTEGHFWRGHASASRVKGTAKIGLLMLACPGSIGSVPRRMF